MSSKWPWDTKGIYEEQRLKEELEEFIERQSEEDEIQRQKQKDTKEKSLNLFYLKKF